MTNDLEHLRWDLPKLTIENLIAEIEELRVAYKKTVRDLVTSEDTLRTEILELKAKRQRLLKTDHLGVVSVWIYQGDGEDHLESLVCPVLMTADEALALQQRAERAEKALATLQQMAKELRDEAQGYIAEETLAGNVVKLEFWKGERSAFTQMRGAIETALDKLKGEPKP